MIKLREQTTCEGDHISPEPSQHTKNIVVFGERGAGKSSLINLLAGRKVSETPGSALGSTLEYKRHLLTIDDQQFAIWHTAGLDGGTQGSVSADKAEAYLKQLLHELAKNNGVAMLVYCVRRTRVRSALLTNYHIFYSAICRKKVPIAIVITGLEDQESSMERWWYKNEPQFTSLKMFFDNHACVTTVESSVESALLKERREISRAAVVKMITSTCRTQQWKPPEHNWVESAYSDILSLLSPSNHNSPLATIMCETSRECPGYLSTRKPPISFPNPVALSLSFSPLSFRSPVSNSNNNSLNQLQFEEAVHYTPEGLYHIYHVPPRQGPPFDSKDKETRKVSDFTVYELPTKKWMKWISPKVRLRVRGKRCNFVSPVVKVDNWKPEADTDVSCTYWSWNTDERLSRLSFADDEVFKIVIEKRLLIGYKCIRRTKPVTISQVRTGTHGPCTLLLYDGQYATEELEGKIIMGKITFVLS